MVYDSPPVTPDISPADIYRSYIKDIVPLADRKVSITGASLNFNFQNEKTISEPGFATEVHIKLAVDLLAIRGGELEVEPGTSVKCKGILPEAHERLDPLIKISKDIERFRNEFGNENKALDAWCKENGVSRERVELARKLRRIAEAEGIPEDTIRADGIVSHPLIAAAEKFFPVQVLEREENRRRLTAADRKVLGIDDRTEITPDKLRLWSQAQEANIPVELYAQFNTQRDQLDLIYDNHRTALQAYQDLLGAAYGMRAEIALKGKAKELEDTGKKFDELAKVTAEQLGLELTARRAVLASKSKHVADSSSLPGLDQIQSLIKFYHKIPLVTEIADRFGYEFPSKITRILLGKGQVMGEKVITPPTALPVPAA